VVAISTSNGEIQAAPDRRPEPERRVAANPMALTRILLAAGLASDKPAILAT
jgi:hypothetical protein